MDNFDLRKYLAEGKLLKEELTYEFSEYDFDITKEPGYQEEVIKHIKSAHPNIEDEIMMKIIRNAENYYYSEARAENKRGREYEPVSSSEFADGVIMDYEDQLPYLEENKLIKEELTWFIDDENSDVLYKNDAYLKEVGDKIKELYPDISDEDLNKIIVMTGDQYSQQEDFHGDSIPSNHFADAAIEIYQTDILAYR